MKFVEPNVFLIGETKIRENELEAFLHYVNASEWITTECSDGEKLIEVMGRICYDSFIPGNNLNVSKVREGNRTYLANILDSNHGCYDEKTEVLTENGWKYFKDITLYDKLATLNTEGFIEYNKPYKLISYYYTGKMYKVINKSVDLFVTPNHNMYVCRTTTKNGRKKNNFEFIKAENLNKISHCYKKNGQWISKEYNNECVLLDNNIGKLLGFAIGDGFLPIYKKATNKLHFHLKRNRKIKWLFNVIDLLGWKLDVRVNDNYVVHIPLEYEKLFISIYDNNKEKVIPNKLLFSTSLEFLQGLYEGLISSDGSVGKTCIIYSSTSKTLIDQFQQLCLHLGFSCNISKKSLPSVNHKDLYTAFILQNNNNISQFNKFKDSVSQTEWIDNWSGQVYCVEIPNHTLYVRRNGKPVWCGNSVLEHCFINFVFTDISKVFSEELVRHRVGTAISGESGRYVRRNELIMWIPETLKNMWPKSFIFFKNMMRMFDWYIKYTNKYSKIDEESIPFSKKKIITSALRRFLPIGKASTYGWSANFRTLRHVINMRTSPHAEEEMILVFNKVAKLCIENYPNVFQDVKIVPIEGTPYNHYIFE